MKKLAVIIKHPYRDFDYRVDIIEVHEDVPYSDIRDKIMREMLGPFKVIAITDRINFDRKVSFDKKCEPCIADLNLTK
jgi:hypothetical protein